MSLASKEFSAMDATAELHYLAALLKAEEGDLDEAEVMLAKLTNGANAVRCLDLLARIAVHRGRYLEARTLWEKVLSHDPANHGAAAAIRKLNSPWIVFAVLNRLAAIAFISVLLAAVVLGMGWLSLKTFQHKDLAAREKSQPEAIKTIENPPPDNPEPPEKTTPAKKLGATEKPVKKPKPQNKKH